MTPRATRVVGDLSTLPRSAEGPASLLWWSNFGFMLIEGSGFALAAGAYLYLQSRGPAWPPTGDQPPDLSWGTVFTIGLVVSALPNLRVARRAKKKDVEGVRIGGVVMTLVGLLLLVVRGFEFAHLNVPWQRDAYGSILWTLMILHTTHVVTDLVETAVISVWLFTHSVGDDQFADVEDNANYWNFIVVAWLPIYALVYWAPRAT